VNLSPFSDEILVLHVLQRFNSKCELLFCRGNAGDDHENGEKVIVEDEQEKKKCELSLCA